MGSLDEVQWSGQQDLRRLKPLSAAKTSSASLSHRSSMAKISEGQSVCRFWTCHAEDVLGLDVSMRNAFIVQVGEALEDLANHPSDFELLEFLRAYDQGE